MDEPSSTDPVAEPSLFTTVEAPSLVGTVLLDRYRVDALLGEGGMGAVYRARHIHMQKDVALKVLHSFMSSNQEVVRRFEREAVVAGRIHHPNVAAASDFGRLADGSFYLVLEYVAGQSLGQLLEATGQLPPERAVRIAAQIASALAAAHLVGIVHRDLKPDNVMLPQGDHEGDIVKVLDFGMAKLQQTDDVASTKLTMHGAVYGTPAYMAPEQAAGNEVDQRADLYALGLILHEMLSGKQTFVADQVMAILIKQMTEAPPALPSTVPRPLAQVVSKLLAKKPEQRHQTADELLADLIEFLGAGYRDPQLSAAGLSSPAFSMRASAASLSGQPSQRANADSPVELALARVKELAEPVVQFLRQDMTVRGTTFPRWLPAAGMFGFVAVLVLLLAFRSSDESDVESSAPSSAAAQVAVPTDVNPGASDPAPPDPELAKVIQAAVSGSDSALWALNQRKDSERSLTEWMGLAQARFMRRQTALGLEALREAIKRDPAMRSDKQTLGILRRLADEEAHGVLVLPFAAEELGNLGADLLFHVWSKTSAKTTSTTLAGELLVTSKVREHYSPALQIAMDLRAAKTCEAAYKLLPRVEAVGDDRTMMRLRQMHKTRGCGATERDDCFPCMRADEALKNATEQAAMRSVFQFETKNWRFKGN